MKERRRFRPSRRVSVSCVLTIVGYFGLHDSVPAQTGHYELVEGQGVELCEAYYKGNLEALKRPISRPCEREINDDVPGFQSFTWHRVDLEKELDLFRRLRKYQVGTHQDQFRPGIYDEDEELQSQLSFHKSRNYRFITRTHADINNDGEVESVLRYWKDGAGCELPNQFGVHLYILTTAPDKEGQIIAASTPEQKLLWEKLSRYGTSFISENIFRYRDITYIDKYCSRENEWVSCREAESLMIYKLQGEALTQKCRYQFVPN